MKNIQRLNFETFFRSNQDTCLSQRPLVKQGQWIGKGQLLADCINSVSGDLSLGKNVLVAYMPWEGYNFEDSIVISNRLIAEDVYTSMHILRFRTEITNTLNTETKKFVDSNSSRVPAQNKFSPTTLPPLPYVRSEAVSNPLVSFPFSASLLSKGSIPSFGQANTGSVFASSLPQRGTHHTSKTQQLLGHNAEIRASLVQQTQKKENKNINLSGGEKRTPNVPFLGDHLLSHLDHNGVTKIGTWLTPGDILVGKVRPLVNKLKSNRASTQLAWEIISSKKSESINVEDRSFRLPKGVFGRVIRTEIISHSGGEHVHVYLAVKRKIQIGDKLAGRHGNKGIVSLVLPKQDMPYIADGTPIDIILSPLGVPSRMNLGQIYECLLGLAAKSLECEFQIDNSPVGLMDESQNIQSFTGSQQKKLHTFRGQSKTNLYSFFEQKQIVPKIPLRPSSFSECFFQSAKTESIDSCLGETPSTFTAEHCSYPLPFVPTTKGEVPLHLITLTVGGERSRCITFFAPLGHEKENSASLYPKGVKKEGQEGVQEKTKKIQGRECFTPFFSPSVIRSNKGIRCAKTQKKQQEYMKSKVLYPRTPPNTYMSTHFDDCPLFTSNFEARNLVFLKLYHSRIICRSPWLFSVTHPGKMRLFDGRTGKPFASWVTVGYAYMLKLIHLVDNKIHSRSTGPYSLITRQPVTGKARQGGQRVGEMEAWALEGFGAAYTLQEFFAFKGDDVSSRHQWKITKLSNIVGNTTAFKTLLSELKALCISLDFTGYVR